MKIKKCLNAIMFIMLIILITFTGGCVNEQEIILDADGTKIEYVIDTTKRSIVVKGYTYQYDVEDDKIIFTYPNNEEVSVMGDEYSLAISVYSDEIRNYLSPEVLYKIYSSKSITIPYLNVVIVIIGILMILLPRVFWSLKYGWAFGMKDCNIAIKVTQIIGIFVVVYGIFV